MFGDRNAAVKRFLPHFSLDVFLLPNYHGCMNWQSLIQETLDLSGLTLTQLAERVGMSKGQLHDLKSGHQRSCMYEAGIALVHQHRIAQRRKPKGNP